MNTQEFLKQFLPAYERGDRGTLHSLRLDIYGETIRIVRQGSYQTETGKPVSLPDPAAMMSSSQLYSTVGKLNLPEQSEPTAVEVWDSDSLLAGKRLIDEGFRPAVLNFANRQRPGGGVLAGAGAQEENIFRRSDLFMSLYQFHPDGTFFDIPQREEQYPMDRTTGGAYSPDVTVFRGIELEGYPLLPEPYRLGIVTVAAMNRPPLKDPEHLADDLEEPTREKIRTIFRIALKHGHDALAAGAWGCGAFRNPPQHIAKLFHEVMEEEEFRNRFRKIVFAIIDRRKLETGHGKAGNFLPFQEEFRPAAPAFNSCPEERFDRFKGMFWGLVVGDCLGSPIQFSPKDGHPYITDMVPCKIFNTPPGYWTDDSSMAFCIAESVIRRGRYDLADIANNFVRWLDEGFWSSLPHAFDVGRATTAAVGGIRRGSLKNGGKDTQGNGSIMRFAPSWILNYGNSDRTVLYEISDLTHNSPAVRETIDLMADICNDHIRGKRTKTPSIYQTREEVGNSGWAVSTLQAALWAFQSTDSFEDGMIAAVNLGGDADSIGAVYGQIAGLYYGYGAIPERWLAAVKDREKVNELIEQFITMKK